MAFFLHRNLPRTYGDLLALCFLLFAIHAIGFFELLHVIPKVYSTITHAGDAYPWKYIHISFGFFIYFNVMLNLYKLMTTNASIRGTVLPTVLKQGWRFCYACECNAPPRSFHCHLCKTCILRRDHHCTFSGNCVGLANHRYYLGLLLYMAIAAMYSCVLNMDFIYHLFGSISPTTLATIAFPMISWIFVQTENVTGFQIFMTSLSVIGLFMSVGLLAYHLINLYHGQSVYERTHNIHDFDLGWKENVKLILGSRWKYALLSPVIPSPLFSDGLEYQTRRDFENIKNM